MAGCERWARGYRAAGTAVLTGGLVLALVNGLLFVVFLAKDRFWMPPLSLHGAELEPAYPGVSRHELHRLLQETWSRPFVYEPFVQFKERPSQGVYVNVHEAGFRVSEPQGPWPPERGRGRTVFLFGGSTAFGYGVADAQTVASRLQRRLAGQGGRGPVWVYNFGRGHYYSTQERVLLDRLLVSRMAPDVAVFLDGINDFGHVKDEPGMTDQLQTVMDGNWRVRALFYLQRDLAAWLPRWPMTRAFEAAKRRLAGSGRTEAPGGPAGGSDEAPPTEHEAGTIQTLLDRYLMNVRLTRKLAEEFGVRVLPVWQPIPYYRLGENPYPFPFREDQRLARAGYPAMAKRVARGDPGTRELLWCANIQEGLREPLYVDSLHYSSALSEAVAGCIADGLIERGWQ